MKAFIKWTTFCLLLTSFCLFSLPRSAEAGHERLRITFVSPLNEEVRFWKIAQNFARAVAKDLDIEFNVVYNHDNNRLTYLDAFKEAFNAPKKPDYVIGIMLRTLAKPILELSKEHHIPVFMVNSDTPEEDKTVGFPRQFYPGFLGHMFPDETKAGALLAKQLITIAQKKYPHERIQVLGLSGHREIQVSKDRVAGLAAATKENGAILKQVIYTNWSIEDAFRRTQSLIKRHSDLHVLWYISDTMALEARKLNHNHRYIIGGFDLSPPALTAIKKGDLDVSVGGHFTEIGLALILLYDYHHKKDFTDQFKEGMITTQMIALQGKNLDQYYNTLTSQDWSHINFKSFSRVLNPALLKYDFSFDHIFHPQQKTSTTQ